MFSVKKTAVWMWSIIGSGEMDGFVGEDGDGTSIDYDEPFIIK